MSTLNRWLQQNSKDSFEQQCQQLTNLLRVKEQALETTSHELKVKNAAMQMLEQKIMSSEMQSTSTQRELTARGERVKALEAEVAAQSKHLTDVEAEGVAARHRVSELNATIGALANELRGAQQACQNAEQTHEVLKEEVRVLREHITQLNEGLADRDHLRARVEKLESVQDRVHQLEVELSDREAAHRGALQQFEQSLIERDHRISEFDNNMAIRIDELRGAQQACQAAEHTQVVLKEEIRVLRDHIVQLNNDLADRDRLRAHLEKLASVQDRVHQLEVELSNRETVHRGAIHQFEQSLAERDGRISEFNVSAMAQLDELRGAQQACQTAEQTREVLKEENRVLRDQIGQLNKDLADRDRLRAQVEKLSKVQDRVHQLEVELSDREAAHRGTLKQLEQSLAERDRRISKFDASAAAQTDKLHEAQQACQTAEQAQGVLKEEIRVLRDHIAQLNEGLADRDRLRAEVEKLSKVRDRVHQLEVELSDREAAHRGTLQQFEQSLAERDGRISEFNASALAQLDEIRGAQQAYQDSEHAQEVLKEDIRVLHNRIAQLTEDLADRDRLRAQLKKLESVQGRVHQLEVELSDREAAHRGTLKQIEKTLAERDRRIEELVPTANLLREKGTELKEWEKKYARTVQEHKSEVVQLQEQCAAQERLREQLLLNEQQLQGRDEQMANLNHQLRDLQVERQNLAQEVQSIPGKDEQIDRLQQRLKELRATLRDKAVPAKATSTKEGSHQARQNGAEPSSQGGQPKISKDAQQDDLKKIHGIGPAFAQTLHKLGTRTFIQIARWKQEDIEKIAKKLETDPERIKREKWIADAKKHHYQKYGERL
jgi:predicted flap endonuclease-1-like 5' DNA nuclease